jgi:hypothetical protein
MDFPIRSEIRQLLAENDLDHIPGRMTGSGVDSPTVKLLMDAFQTFAWNHYRAEEATHTEIHNRFTLRRLSARDSFIWRMLLGCEPSTELRDYATERLRELHAINAEISMEPITPREVVQIVDTVIGFLGQPHSWR